MIPGVMADAQSFAPVMEAIDRPEPVLIVDRRGRSASGPLGEDYSVETEVADAQAWIEHLGGRAALAGWSYGGTIALEVASRDPRAAGVVAYDPGIGPFDAEILAALRAAVTDRRVEIINLDFSRVPAAEVEALRASPVWPELRRLAEPLADELTAASSFEPSDAWAAVRAELIIGEHSQGVEPYGPAFDRVVERMPRARTTVLPGHGHLAHRDDPFALGRLLGELLPRS